MIENRRPHIEANQNQSHEMIAGFDLSDESIHPKLRKLAKDMLEKASNTPDVVALKEEAGDNKKYKDALRQTFLKMAPDHFDDFVVRHPKISKQMAERFPAIDQALKRTSEKIRWDWFNKHERPEGYRDIHERLSSANMKLDQVFSPEEANEYVVLKGEASQKRKGLTPAERDRFLELNRTFHEKIDTLTKVTQPPEKAPEKTREFVVRGNMPKGDDDEFAGRTNEIIGLNGSMPDVGREFTGTEPMREKERQTKEDVDTKINVGDLPEILPVLEENEGSSSTETERTEPQPEYTNTSSRIEALKQKGISFDFLKVLGSEENLLEHIRLVKKAGNEDESLSLEEELTLLESNRKIVTALEELEQNPEPQQPPEEMVAEKTNPMIPEISPTKNRWPKREWLSGQLQRVGMRMINNRMKAVPEKEQPAKIQSQFDTLKKMQENEAFAQFLDSVHVDYQKVMDDPEYGERLFEAFNVKDKAKEAVASVIKRDFEKELGLEITDPNLEAEIAAAIERRAAENPEAIIALQKSHGVLKEQDIKIKEIEDRLNGITGGDFEKKLKEIRGKEEKLKVAQEFGAMGSWRIDTWRSPFLNDMLYNIGLNFGPLSGIQHGDARKIVKEVKAEMGMSRWRPTFGGIARHAKKELEKIAGEANALTKTEDMQRVLFEYKKRYADMRERIIGATGFAAQIREIAKTKIKNELESMLTAKEEIGTLADYEKIQNRLNDLQNRDALTKVLEKGDLNEIQEKIDARIEDMVTVSLQERVSMLDGNARQIPEFQRMVEEIKAQKTFGSKSEAEKKAFLVRTLGDIDREMDKKKHSQGTGKMRKICVGLLIQKIKEGKI